MIPKSNTTPRIYRNVSKYKCMILGPRLQFEHLLPRGSKCLLIDKLPCLVNFKLPQTSPRPSMAKCLPTASTHTSSHANSFSSPPYKEAISHNGRVYRVNVSASNTSLTTPTQLYHPPSRTHWPQRASPPLFQVPPLRLLYTSRALLITTAATIKRFCLVPSLQSYNVPLGCPLHPPRDPHALHNLASLLHHNTISSLSSTPYHRIAAGTPWPWNPDVLLIGHVSVRFHNALYTNGEDSRYSRQ